MKPSHLLLVQLGLLSFAALLQGILSAIGHPVSEFFVSLWWGLLGALLCLSLLDAWWVRRLPSPDIQRSLPGHLSLGRWSEIRLKIQHSYHSPLDVQLYDHVPDAMAFEYLPQRVRLNPGQHSEIGYRLRPLQRGHFHFERCELLLPSPLRLWQARRYIALHNSTRVFPDFTKIYGNPLLGLDHWISQQGIRQQPRRGQGMEFHQLREFREGDSLRQIDWKATARKRAPIAREYQDERDQQIMLMLDCGRRMRSQDADLGHFDQALNASLLLSYVALRQGDAVGLCTLASHQPRFLAPAKGNAQLSQVLNNLYDLQSTARPADFSAAFSHLMAQQKRRALVLLITNLRDEDDEQLLSAVQQLQKKHRLVIASLREEVLDQLQHTPVQTHEQALLYCSTQQYLSARQQLHERLQNMGIPVIDTRPSELGPALISRYLAWKKSGNL